MSEAAYMSGKSIIVRRQVVCLRLDGPLLTPVQALNAFKVSRSQGSLPVMMERQRTCSSSAPHQTARRRATLTSNAYGHGQKQHVRLPDHEIVMRQAATRTPYVGHGRYAPLLKVCLTQRTPIWPSSCKHTRLSSSLYASRAHVQSDSKIAPCSIDPHGPLLQLPI